MCYYYNETSREGAWPFWPKQFCSTLHKEKNHLKFVWGWFFMVPPQPILFYFFSVIRIYSLISTCNQDTPNKLEPNSLAYNHYHLFQWLYCNAYKKWMQYINQLNSAISFCVYFRWINTKGSFLTIKQIDIFS